MTPKKWAKAPDEIPQAKGEMREGKRKRWWLDCEIHPSPRHKGGAQQ